MARRNASVEGPRLVVILVLRCVSTSPARFIDAFRPRPPQPPARWAEACLPVRRRYRREVERYARTTGAGCGPRRDPLGTSCARSSGADRGRSGWATSSSLRGPAGGPASDPRPPSERKSDAGAGGYRLRDGRRPLLAPRPWSPRPAQAPGGSPRAAPAPLAAPGAVPGEHQAPARPDGEPPAPTPRPMLAAAAPGASPLDSRRSAVPDGDAARLEQALLDLLIAVPVPEAARASCASP